jgi:hypothetical protein
MGTVCAEPLPRGTARPAAEAVCDAPQEIRSVLLEDEPLVNGRTARSQRYRINLSPLRHKHEDQAFRTFAR